jgi:ribosome-binding factor A
MRHEPKAQSAAGEHRHQRIEASILEELNTLLRDEISDPELENVRISALVLSPDSKLARAHFVVPRGRPRSAVERAFARAAGFLRGRLSEGVEMKRTPELRFVYEAEIDPTADERA